MIVCQYEQIGSFFVLNMILVVISVQFGETKNREMKAMSLEQAKEAAHSKKNHQVQSQIGCWEGILQALGQLIFESAIKLFPSLKSKPKEGDEEEDDLQVMAATSVRHTTVLKLLCCCCFKGLSKTQLFKFVFNVRDKFREFAESKYFQQSILAAILFNSVFMGIEHHDQVNKY